MGGIVYSAFTATGLIILGSYSLLAAIYAYLQASSISNGSESRYTAKPYHPFPAAHSSADPGSRKGAWWNVRQRGGLYLIVAWLMVAILHEILSAADFDPLVKGHTAVHRFTALQSSAVLLLFLVLSISLIFLPILDVRLFFALFSVAFLLHSTTSSSAASLQTSDLQGHLSSVSSRVSAVTSLISLALAVNPNLFQFEVGLWASVLLQGFWNLQTGLSLYVDAFIPDGCHRLLDVPAGIDGSTKCELEDSRLRAFAILDFMFVLYVIIAIVIVATIYAVLAKAVCATAGGPRSRAGSYEALPTSESGSTMIDSIQMKTLAGTQA